MNSPPANRRLEEQQKPARRRGFLAGGIACAKAQRQEGTGQPEDPKEEALCLEPNEPKVRGAETGQVSGARGTFFQEQVGLVHWA